MDLQRTKHEIKLAEWSRKIANCRSSGMQVAQWCQAHGMNPSTYYRWQRQVWDAGIAQAQEGQALPEREPAPPRKWTQLTAGPTGPTISVEINGCRVEVTAKTDQSLLSQVCRLLRDL